MDGRMRRAYPGPGTSAAVCISDYLSDAQKQAVAPFLYYAGLSPTVSIPAPAAHADMGRRAQRTKRVHHHSSLEMRPGCTRRYVSRLDEVRARAARSRSREGPQSVV
jgi:hypothetical protein